MKTETAQSISRGLWVGLAITVVLVGVRVLSIWIGDLNKENQLQVYGQIPEFSLMDQEGDAFTFNENLKGSVWVADFIFTRCGGPCPIMTAKMKTIQKNVEKTPGVQLVSFSVDPEYDRPEVLKEYAQKFEANTDQWAFLTGEQEVMHQLSEQHFYLGAGKVVPEEAGEAAHQFHHSTKFVLIDQAGQIRGYYDSASSEDMNRLLQNAGSLAGK